MDNTPKRRTGGGSVLFRDNSAEDLASTVVVRAPVVKRSFSLSAPSMPLEEGTPKWWLMKRYGLLVQDALAPSWSPLFVAGFLAGGCPVGA